MSPIAVWGTPIEWGETGLTWGGLDPEPLGEPIWIDITGSCGSVGDDLYKAMLPLAFEDEALGWPLKTFCCSLGDMLQEIDDLVRDTQFGPGWSTIVDADRTPNKWIPWLAQFIGVEFPFISDYNAARQVMKDAPGWKRGTPLAMVKAAKPLLTGNQTVIMKERYGVVAWPDASVKDYGDRDDENPLAGAGRWGAKYSTDDRQLILSGGHFVNSDLGGIASSYYTPLLAANQEAFVTIVGATGKLNIQVRTGALGAGAHPVAYRAIFDPVAGTVSLWRVTNAVTGAVVQIGSTVTGVTLQPNVRCGVRVVGSKLKVYVGNQRVIEQSDGNITSSGYVVIRIDGNATLRHFGAGNWTPNGAYKLTVITYDAETPNPGAVLAALISQKPAGLFLEYNLRQGQIYETLRDLHDDYQDVKDSYDDYEAARDDMPPV